MIFLLDNNKWNDQLYVASSTKLLYNILFQIIGIQTKVGT